jgi:hypothetical protein
MNIHTFYMVHRKYDIIMSFKIFIFTFSHILTMTIIIQMFKYFKNIMRVLQPKTRLALANFICITHKGATSHVVICSASDSESDKSQISTTNNSASHTFLKVAESNQRYYWLCLSDSLSDAEQIATRLVAP